MRQIEVKVTKAEARLEALRGAGIDIHKWLQKAKDNHKNDQLQPSTLGKLATIASERKILSLNISMIFYSTCKI